MRGQRLVARSIPVVQPSVARGVEQLACPALSALAVAVPWAEDHFSDAAEDRASGRLKGDAHVTGNEDGDDGHKDDRRG